METNLFNTRSSLNPKEGLALLVKAPAESPIQEVQPDGSSLFAGMLVQKISEVIPLGSTNPPTAAQGGKRPRPAALKGMIPIGKGEPVAGGTTKPEAGRHPHLSTSSKEPLNGIAGEAGLIAGHTENISPSPAEKTEPAKDSKAAIHCAREMMEAAVAIPATGESTPHADPPPTENAHSQIETPFLPDTALLARAIHLPEMKHLEGAMDAAPTGKHVGKELPASASHEVRPLSDRHAYRRSALKGDERGTETGSMQQTVEAPQQKNGGSAADSSLDPHPPSTSHRDHGRRAGESREGESITAAPQKTVSAVLNGEPTPELATPAGSQGKALPTGDVMAETPAPARDHGRNTTASQPVGHSEREIFPFRMEMPNTISPQGANTPAAVSPTGIEMQAVIDQLLEARQVAGNDFGRIRIILNPPNLGTVDLDIVVRGEKVEVVMTAENATVQQALQSRGDDIRIALQRQDLKIEGFQVLLQDNGTGQQQTHGGAMYRQDREYREGFIASEDAPPPLPVVSAIEGAKTASGRVSIFA